MNHSYYTLTLNFFWFPTTSPLFILSSSCYSNEEDRFEGLSEKLASSTVDGQVNRTSETSESVDDQDDIWSEVVVKKLPVLFREYVEDGDYHERNFDHEKGGDNEDQHSGYAQRFFHFLSSLVEDVTKY